MDDTTLISAESMNGQPRKRAVWATPSLVSYGTLFAETNKAACSDLHADAGHPDYCDPDGGPVDGTK